jgi:gliding motility-associated-like protein
MNDPAYVTESGACYKISYLDVCGNQSALSAEACPVRVNGNLLKDNSVNLTWTPYSGWQQGVSSYTVEKYSEQGQLLQTFDAGASLNFVDDTQDLNNQIYIYLIKANASEAGLPQAASNRIVIIKDPNLFYPTAFTPNGDNLNDIFNVFGQYIVTFEMDIFNRWGELVYTTSELEQGWDGYYKGNLMPEGTYTFIAEITDRAGRTIKKSGSVLLLKKGK